MTVRTVGVASGILLVVSLSGCAAHAGKEIMMSESAASGTPIPIIIDTDIGEDIDDLLVLAFALNSPEFEVVGVTTVDGDTAARSRIARRVTAAFGCPDIPVVAGYPRSMPAGPEPYPPLTAVTQNALAPTEAGLPPGCQLRADQLIAKLAAERPGQVVLCTIGSMTNVGQTLVRHPETARHLKAIVTNGGNFGPDRETSIGWNVRYDPVAAAVVARSEARWVLLSEGSTRWAAPRAEDVERLRTRGLPTTDILFLAIQEWRTNKRECTPTSTPHVSDLVGFAYLLNDAYIATHPGRVYITVGPRPTLAELRVEEDPEGPHRLGSTVPRDRAVVLHDLLMKRLLAEPIHLKRGAR